MNRIRPLSRLLGFALLTLAAASVYLSLLQDSGLLQIAMAAKGGVATVMALAVFRIAAAAPLSARAGGARR
ncbi:MAG: hypothetical protein RIR62_1893 [Pseudomonadota bacterium]|jgi:hypothetical protein